MGSHAVYTSATQQAHYVNLVRRLAVDDATTGRRVELFRTTRAVQEIGEIHRRDHPDIAKHAAVDELPRAPDRQVEAVAVADDEMHARTAGRLDHAGAFFQAQGHRLFDHHMLAERCGQAHMTGMKLVRRGNIEHFHRRVSAKRFDGRMAGCAEVALELRPGRRNRVGGAHQLDAAVMHEGRQHQGKCPTQAHNADLHFPTAHRSSTSSPDFARDTHTMM